MFCQRLREKLKNGMVTPIGPQKKRFTDSFEEEEKQRMVNFSYNSTKKRITSAILKLYDSKKIPKYL